MLPFLKNRQQAGISGVIMKTRAPDKQDESEQDDPGASIHACAEELIRALHARDPKAVAAALKDAFDILDSQPHIEGPHLNEDEE